MKHSTSFPVSFRDRPTPFAARSSGTTLGAILLLFSSCTSGSTADTAGSGGSGGAGSSSGGATTGGIGGEGSSCEDPEELRLIEVSAGQGGAGTGPELELGDAPAGIVLCADGALVRERQRSCDLMPLSRIDLCDGFAPEFPPICSAEFFDESGNPTCEGADCWAAGECQVDDDCETGHVCSCAADLAGSTSAREQTGFTRCVPADCSTNSDCGDYDCAADLGPCGVGVESFHCHTPDDECHGHDDCESSGRCTFSEEEERWVCGEWALCE